MNTKVFSHNDLDGVGCRILLQLEFDDEGDYEHVGNSNANERIVDFVESGEYKNYKNLYVTDLPLLPETLLKLADVGKEINIYFIDHHVTTIEKLNVEEYTKIFDAFKLFFSTRACDEATSATFITGLCLSIKDRYEFIKDVTDYDTWVWTENNNIRAKRLNDILYLIGTDDFVESAIDIGGRMDDITKGMLDKYGILLEIEERRINQYIEKKDKEKIILELDGYKTAVVSSENYQSQLGHALLERNDDIDIIFMINAGKSVSLRSRKHVDVSAIAKRFGGGGHPQSSGFSIRGEFLVNLYNDIIILGDKSK